MSRQKVKPFNAEGWRDVAAALGGDYVEGGLLRSDGVEVARGGWTVTLDTYLPIYTKVPYTRVRAEFASLDGLRLRLYPRHVLSGVGALLGLQDVEIGDAAFDHAFIIKASDEAKVRALFSDPKLRARVAAEPQLILALQDVEATSARGFIPPDAVQLSCIFAREIWDVGRLAALVDLVASTLDRLRRLGSAPATGLCPACGYSLFANVSGVCPECGLALAPPTSMPDENPRPRKRSRRKGARGRGTRPRDPA